MRKKIKTKMLSIRGAPDELSKLHWLALFNNKSQGVVVWELIKREYDRLKEVVNMVKRQ